MEKEKGSPKALMLLSGSLAVAVSSLVRSIFIALWLPFDGLILIGDEGIYLTLHRHRALCMVVQRVFGVGGDVVVVVIQIQCYIIMYEVRLVHVGRLSDGVGTFLRSMQVDGVRGVLGSKGKRT